MQGGDCRRRNVVPVTPGHGKKQVGAVSGVAELGREVRRAARGDVRELPPELAVASPPDCGSLENVRPTLKFSVDRR